MWTVELMKQGFKRITDFSCYKKLGFSYWTAFEGSTN